jgi:2-methylcitrate dehydratase PrpD
VTGTVGTFGAAAAAGKLLGLAVEPTCHALGIAGTLASGLAAMHGTMCKPLHPGKAAMHGLMAGLLAARGFDSSTRVLESPKGFGWVLAGDRDFGEITDGLGERWEMRRNGFKPYASGVVTHPVIDAVLHLREQHDLRVEEVASLEARVSPLVLEPTGNREPRTGLEGKFSVYHCAAIALLEGEASEAQFTDEKVSAPATVRLRERVAMVADDAVRKGEAHVVMVLRDGRCLESHVEHATGTAGNPMSDEQLGRKFLGLATPMLGQERAHRVIDLVNGLETLSDSGELVRACVPNEVMSEAAPRP